MEKDYRMKAFKVFVFGLLYGILFKYAIDRIYRGNDMEDLRNENASLQEYIRTLELKLRTSSPQAGSLQGRSAETKPVTPPAPQPASVRTESLQPAQSISEKDNLKTIKGIGPAIEKKLNNAGIYTFDALARLRVAELEEILGNARRLAQEGDLIAQAKQLARQRKR
jgi:predicted flap endonuclease-1-like 5' DNA nuclease